MPASKKKQKSSSKNTVPTIRNVRRMPEVHRLIYKDENEVIEEQIRQGDW
jgi:hypothetical protein